MSLKYVYEFLEKEHDKPARGDIQTNLDLGKMENWLDEGHFIRIYKSESPDKLEWVIMNHRDLMQFVAANHPDVLVSDYTAHRAAAPTAADNPKVAAGSVKMKGLSVIPPIALVALGEAMGNGAEKYGPFNWRSTGVLASSFYDAMFRHLLDAASGEEHATDSGIRHLAHLIAGGAIVLDAQLHGILEDDRHCNEQFATNVEAMRKFIRNKD